MSGTESRLRTMIDEHLALGHAPDLNRSFSESGISSLNAVAFIRVVEREFDVSIPPEDCNRIGTLAKLIGYLDTKV
ncbi:MAG: acyl carrier protein [Gemmatimonadetes bacterium]|nr:acyl carrier protein [Gemmatimonadota bacterium]